jgi:cereblon
MIAPRMRPMREATPEGGGQKKGDPKGQDAPIEEERHSLLCKTCESEVSDSRALFCMRAPTVEQVFPNPYGHMRVILTAIEAHSWTIGSEPTTDFTWFAGYAWTVIDCASCHCHLGWLYEATGGESPARFYGLLKDAIVER